jgi:excisionase family DNA binding protein
MKRASMSEMKAEDKFLLPTEQMVTTPNSEWLTAEEAAKYLRLKPRTLLLWARQRRVKAFALSGTRRHVWRFRRQDLDTAFLESPVLASTTPSVRPAERMAK